MAKDPVCGMFVDETPEALRVSQRGTTFYFCSSGCLQTFIAPAKELGRLKWMTALSFALGVPTLVFTWIPAAPAPVPNSILLLALATPVQFVAGWEFYRGAWHALRARAANMDLLIAIGTTAAWSYSAAVALAPGVLPEGTYFDASSLIIGFILLGKLLEHVMRRRASDSIRKLLAVSPTTATVIRNGVETTVPVEEVRSGDLVRVRPGEKIPTDGVIVEGNGAIDERMFTGESIPVERKEGDELFGAATNQTGLLTVRATKVGADTALAQIVKLVEDAQAGQAPIQRLADKVASYFVPAVVLVALGSLVAWVLAEPHSLHGFTAFIAVLIVACPCALGLATPAAMVVGTGKGASNGILIKGGDVLERADKVDVVVFDKTGTLTAGSPSVTDVVTLGGLAEEEVLGLAASAEFGSEHPIGAAMVTAARATKLRVERPTGFAAVPGLGVKATIGKSKVVVGRPVLLEQSGIDHSRSDGVSSDLEKEGKTAMAVAVDGKAVGVVAVADTVKPGARDTVEALKGGGIRVIMLTGDNDRTARAIASQVGIDEVESGVLPGQKSERIKALKGEGHVVAMVGDGINDAPALAQADLGIAIGTGTDVAIDSAGMVLIKDDLRDVVGALKLSRATMRKIRQNLFWAFAYNLVLIPVAATGFLNPILAGIAMALSSVSVLANSLSLNRLRLGPTSREALPARPAV